LLLIVLKELVFKKAHTQSKLTAEEETGDPKFFRRCKLNFDMSLKVECL